MNRIQLDSLGDVAGRVSAAIALLLKGAVKGSRFVRRSSLAVPAPSSLGLFVMILALATGGGMANAQSSSAPNWTAASSFCLASGPFGFNIINTCPPPPKRFDAAMAPAPGGKGVLLFGGVGEGNPSTLGDFWAWGLYGSYWTQLTSKYTRLPPARHGAMMALDSRRNEVVLYGGQDVNGTALGDTWVFDWNQGWQGPFPGPSPRKEAAMTYDPLVFFIEPDGSTQLGGMVLFGGVGEGVSADSFAWDGSRRSWSVQGPVDPPEVRSQMKMVNYPPLRNGEPSANILFGGFGVASGRLDDTWVLEAEPFGLVWFPVSPAAAPSPRMYYGMEYYPAAGRVVLFGGDSSTGRSAETWSFAGSDPLHVAWTQQFPASSPTARRGHSMAYSASNGQVLLFGGLDGTGLQNDTWLWGPSAQCTHEPGDSLPAGAGTECTFTPIAEAHFDRWEASGFTPSASTDPTQSFEAVDPGAASIAAVWMDREGKEHRMNLDYAVTSPRTGCSSAGGSFGAFVAFAVAQLLRRRVCRS